MASMLLIPVVELLIRSSPMRIHSPAWRLGVISTAATVAGSPLLALLVMFAIALAAEERAVVAVVSAISGAAAVLCVLATGLFALDALQMKGDVRADLADSYGVGSTWVVIRLVATAIMFAVLAISAFRSASTRRVTTVAQSPKGGAAVLVSGARPPAPGGSSKRVTDAVGESR
jgi:hypothetical protein